MSPGRGESMGEVTGAFEAGTGASRRRSLRLAALALGAAVALLVGEGVARVVEWRRDGQAPAEAGERLVGYVRPEPRPVPGEFRILVVGDSFTDGGGLFPGEPYPHRLASELAGRFGREAFEVLTLAESGLNTRREVRLARPWVEALAPDLILVAVCLNDPEPSSAAQRRRALDAAGWREVYPATTRPVYRRSALVRLAVDAYLDRSSRQSLRRYYASWYDESLPTWRAFEGAMRRFRRLAREHGSELVLVVFPIFDSPLDDRYPYRELHARLARLAGDLEIPLLDLLPVYAGFRTRELAVVPFTDPHPNARAHAIAADRILEFLLAEDLLAKRSRRR